MASSSSWLDLEQVHAEPAALTDVRRAEEAVGLGLDHLRLHAVGSAHQMANRPSSW